MGSLHVGHFPRRPANSSLAVKLAPHASQLTLIMQISEQGPKAGGPHYLHRFCAERTLTINTTAAGGNVALLA